MINEIANILDIDIDIDIDIEAIEALASLVVASPKWYTQGAAQALKDLGVEAPGSLVELRDALVAADSFDDHLVDWSSLPCYCDAECPNDEAWSWDGQFMLVGRCASELEIVNVAEYMSLK